MRAPAVAGLFYPEEPAELRRVVQGCYTHRLGPGKVPEVAPARRRGLHALVVPHAGLTYSGPVAAHAYAALAAEGWPEAVVLLGPSHAGLGGLGALSSADWRTPLGVASQHEGLRAALAEGGLLLEDDAAHADEHSLEVQLPFLLDLAARGGRELRFVPLVLGLQDEATAREVGAAVARAVRAAGVDAVVLASSDWMHAGPNYRVPVPRGQTVDAFVRAQDERALQPLLALDGDRLVDEVRRHEVTMCGVGPVAAAVHAARALGATRAEVLAHATSHDVQPHHSVVGYAAVALR